MMEDKIKDLMEDIFELDSSSITEELKAVDVPLWDSLKHLSFITALEDEFEVKLSMNEIQSIDGYSKILEIVKKHTQ